MGKGNGEKGKNRGMGPVYRPNTWKWGMGRMEMLRKTKNKQEQVMEGNREEIGEEKGNRQTGNG